MKTIMIVAGFGDSLLLFRKELIAGWVKNGYRVVALAPEANVKEGIQSMGAEYSTIPLQRTALNPLADFMLLCSLKRMIKNSKPGYIFLYTIKPVIYGSLAAYFFKHARVFSMITGLGYAFVAKDEKSILRRVVICLYRLALKRNEKVFFQNPDDLKYFINQGIIEAKKTVLINGSGVNLEHFRSEMPVFGQPVFLMIARWLKEKGIVEYYEAANLLKDKYPEARFKLIGWDLGDNNSYAGKDILEKCKKDGAVELFEKTDDVRPYLKGSSVYVLPSYREGTPRTVLEAMAVGRAIITTDVPGCRETVVDGLNGFLVPAKDSRALAGAMERFIIEPELVFKMGRESRRIAEEKYDVHQVNRVINREMEIK